MFGAFFILDDPVSNGLAISPIFGILVCTVLTLVVISLLYFVAYLNRLGDITGPDPHLDATAAISNTLQGATP